MVDYAQFEEFGRTYKRINKTYFSFLKQFMAEQGNKFIDIVVPLTPVDTGLLSSSWKIDKVVRIRNDVRTFFSNDTYYCDFVEYGHAKPYKAGAKPGSADWVKGYFMMTKALRQIYREIDEDFELAFVEFIERLGGL